MSPVGITGRAARADVSVRTLTWSDAGDWDAFQDQTGAVHANAADTDYGDDTIVVKGYSPDNPLYPSALELAVLCHEDSGSTLHDQSGNGYNATLSGATPGVTGLNGNTAVSFDGSDDGAQTASMTDMSTSTHVSISLWYKPPNSLSGSDFDNAIFAIGDGSEGITLWIAGGSGMQGEGEVFAGTEGDNTSGSQSISISDGGWHHLAISWDMGSTITQYVDGRQDYSVSYTDTSATSGATVSIADAGALNSAGNECPGDIAEILVWYGQLLDSGDVTDLYDTVVGESTIITGSKVA